MKQEQDNQEQIKRKFTETEQIKKSPWIQAWSDSVAGVHVFSQQMALADIKDDGDYKLVLADNKGQIKMYMGTNVIYEEKLKAKPVGIAVTYPNSKKPLVLPYICVGLESSVIVYYNQSPFIKFDIPPVQFSQEEKAVWEQLSTNLDALPSSLDKLVQIRESGTQLSALSTELLAIENVEDQKLFVKQHAGATLMHQNFVTCIGVIQKGLDEEKAVSQLVIGTENGELLIMDPGVKQIKNKIELKSVPVYLDVQGQYDVDYRILVACRDGKIYSIRNGQDGGQLFSIDSMPIGMVRLDKTILIAGMNQTLYSFFTKGKKNFTLIMPEQILAICKLEMQRTTLVQGVLVSLKNGEVRLYNDKSFISSIKNDDMVSGMIFGTFGREDGFLVLNYASGGLSAKILTRNANLTSQGGKPGPLAMQDTPLNVPKKTQLFMELVKREKEHGLEMHRQFQKDLCRMRLKTAKTYISMLSTGLAPMSYAQGSQVRLTALYEGIGPVFKIKLQLQNLGKSPIINTRIMLVYSEELYKQKNRSPKLPLMLPGLTYKLDVEVENISPTGAADVIKVFVFNAESSVPLITANLSMPLSEIDINA